MQTVASLNIAYTEEKGYVTADIAKAENLHVLNLSGTKFRQMLRAGDDIPEWCVQGWRGCRGWGQGAGGEGRGVGGAREGEQRGRESREGRGGPREGEQEGTGLRSVSGRRGEGFGVCWRLAQWSHVSYPVL